MADHLKVFAASDIFTYQADLVRFDNHDEMIRNAIASLGQIDIVLVAHGALGNQKECERSFESAQRNLDANFTSTASLLTRLACYFEQQRQGTIAAISSVAGDRGRKSNYCYGCAKGALNIFLQGLRNRLYESGVNVITLKPGFVATSMTAHLRKNFLFADPASVARAIVRTIDSGKDVKYIPGYWHWIMLIIRLIPEKIFKQLNL